MKHGKPVARRTGHKARKVRDTKSGPKHNIAGTRHVAAKQLAGRIHDLETGLVDDSTVQGLRDMLAGVAPVKRTPIEQAVNNWLAVQHNMPLWWLSFSLNGENKGVAVVRAWTFLGAVNRTNKLRISIPGAAVYGEELNDMAMVKEDWLDKLWDEKEMQGMMRGGIREVSEQTLYGDAKGEEVKFK